MAERAQQLGGVPNGLGALRVGGNAGLEGMVEEPDPQLARVRTHLLREGPPRVRRDVGIAGLVPGDAVEQRRGVAHGPGDDAVARRAHPLLADRRVRHPATARLQAHQPALAGRDADGATAVVGVGGRHHPCRHRGGGTTGRPAGRVLGVPRVAARAIGQGLRGDRAAQLRRVRPAHHHQPGGEEPAGQRRVLGRPEASLLQEAAAHVVRVAGHGDAQVLQQERHAPERTVGQRAGRLAPGGLEPLVDHRVDLRVHLLDALDGGVDQLEGRHLPVADERGLRGGIEGAEVVVGWHGPGSYGQRRALTFAGARPRRHRQVPGNGVRGRGRGGRGPGRRRVGGNVRRGAGRRRGRGHARRAGRPDPHDDRDGPARRCGGRALAAAPGHRGHRDGAGLRTGAGRRRGGERSDRRVHPRDRRADRLRARRGCEAHHRRHGRFGDDRRRLRRRPRHLRGRAPPRGRAAGRLRRPHALRRRRPRLRHPEGGHARAGRAPDPAPRAAGRRLPGGLRRRRRTAGRWRRSRRVGRRVGGDRCRPGQRVRPGGRRAGPGRAHGGRRRDRDRRGLPRRGELRGQGGRRRGRDGGRGRAAGGGHRRRGARRRDPARRAARRVAGRAVRAGRPPSSGRLRPSRTPPAPSSPSWPADRRSGRAGSGRRRSGPQRTSWCPR